MVMVYLGGMGSLSGSVLSAVFFTFLLELMRPLQILKWVFIPLLLILLMQFRPEGLMGHRELPEVVMLFRAQILRIRNKRKSGNVDGSDAGDKPGQNGEGI
jgi:branched-chain amino acid transport system permease protein